MSPFQLIALVFVTIAGLGSLSWGWPGTLCLVALVPSSIIGLTLSHVLNARKGLVALRPGAIAIAFFLGSTGLVLSGGLFKAANTPAKREISSQTTTNLPAKELLSFVRNPINLSRWNGFYQDVERIGSANGEPGSTYNVSLKFENQVVPAQLIVQPTDDPLSVRWKVDFGKNAKIEEFFETLTILEGKKERTLRHDTSYRVDSVVVRMLNNFVVGDMFASFSAESLQNLINEVDG